jgi:ribosomal protein S18 acetylase RimI-like enzyme
VLTATGFRHLADLVYLSCESDRFCVEPFERAELEFEVYDEAQRHRLVRLIERTYEGTLDCAELNGRRSINAVIDGYRATGDFCAENWRIVCNNSHDVGVLLLAHHRAAEHVELVYMGLLKKYRGRGWGRQIVQCAQVLARRARVSRIVLAVDAANEPALRMYHSTGFEAWDRRAVYVRFLR